MFTSQPSAIITWPESSLRYKKLAKFVEAFFGKIDPFHNGAGHPKLSEINLSAEIPGWTHHFSLANSDLAHNSKATQGRPFPWRQV